MSDFDSDDDIFYGPITTKEIDFEWKRLLAEKNKREVEAKRNISQEGETVLTTPEKEIIVNKNVVTVDLETQRECPAKISLLQVSINKSADIPSELNLSVKNPLNNVERQNTGESEFDKSTIASEIEKQTDVSLNQINSTCAFNVLSVEADQNLEATRSRDSLKENTEICRSDECETFVEINLNDYTLSESTFADKSLISVRGQNRYEVYIPTPSKRQMMGSDMSTIDGAGICTDEVVKKIVMGDSEDCGMVSDKNNLLESSTNLVEPVSIMQQSGSDVPARYYSETMEAKYCDNSMSDKMPPDDKNRTQDEKLINSCIPEINNMSISDDRQATDSNISNEDVSVVVAEERYLNVDISLGNNATMINKSTSSDLIADLNESSCDSSRSNIENNIGMQNDLTKIDENNMNNSYKGIESEIPSTLLEQSLVNDVYTSPTVESNKNAEENSFLPIAENNKSISKSPDKLYTNSLSKGECKNDFTDNNGVGSVRSYSVEHDMVDLIKEQENTLTNSIIESSKTINNTSNTEAMEVDVVVEANEEDKSSSSGNSFVSLPRGDTSIDDDTLYVPCDKKQCLSVSNSENNMKTPEAKRSKIPVFGSSKLPVIKPPTLKLDNYTENRQWKSELKKKVPKVKRPYYIVSPSRFNELSEFKGLKDVRPHSAGPTGENVYKPLQPNSRLYSVFTNLKTNTPKFNSKLKTPTSVNRTNLTSVKPTPKSALKPPMKSSKYTNIGSPVANYINSSTPVILRNVTPSKRSPLQLLNKLPAEFKRNGNSEPEKLQTPTLPQKYYSSANKILTKEGHKKSPILPRLGEKQAAALVPSKPHIFKHLGRVNSEEKSGQFSVVPRPLRKTCLQETSFANLPGVDKKLDMSVLEKL